jgi:5-methylcytosine-specific restriction endonuclease McrA
VRDSGQYQRTYRLNRRQQATAHLGGICVECGTAEDLEFDHIERASKSIEISRAIDNHWAWERLVEELAKCQLLCGPRYKEVEPQHGSVVQGGSGPYSPSPPRSAPPRTPMPL